MELHILICRLKGGYNLYYVILWHIVLYIIHKIWVTCNQNKNNIYSIKYNTYILKTLTRKKLVIRIQHNLFVHATNLSSLITKMKEIIKNDGFIEVQNFKEKFPMSRKYIIAYLDYLDNIQGIEKRENKRYLIS